jgi:hypothetical protein
MTDRRQSIRASGNVTARLRGPADTLLAACIVGLAIAPLPLLLLGGRSEWGSVFGIVAGAVVLSASGALVCRYVVRRADTARSGTGGRVVEAASWVVVIAFMIVGSGINLAVGIERAGIVADSFLLLTLLGLPVVVLRRTAIEGRLTRLPRAGVRIGATAALVIAGLVALIDLATPARFPGGRKSRHADDPVGSLVRSVGEILWFTEPQRRKIELSVASYHLWPCSRGRHRRGLLAPSVAPKRTKFEVPS